jgi:hypothetical protein
MADALDADRSPSKEEVMIRASVTSVALIGLSLAGVTVGASNALAGTGTSCQAFLPLPGLGTQGKSRDLMISLASCAAELRMDRVVTHDSVRALHQLEAAIAPSARSLDAIAAHGTPRQQILAAETLGDLHESVAIRARDAIQPLGLFPSVPQMVQYRAAHVALEPLLVPELDAARAAYARVDQIALRHVMSAWRDPVIERAVIDATRALGTLPDTRPAIHHG